MRRAAFSIFLLSNAIFAQKAFEVASVHLAQPFSTADVAAGRVRIGLKLDGALADYGSMPLGALIQQAYKVERFQVAGPNWMSGGEV